MPIQYRIDGGTGVIHARFEGEITAAMLYDYNQRLREDPAFRPGLVELVEVDDIRPELGFPELSNYSVWLKGLEPIRKTAIIARDDMAFGMARMFQQISDSEAMEVQVFRDAEAAEAWLSGEG